MYIFYIVVIVIIFALVFRHYTGTIKTYRDNVYFGYEKIQGITGRIINKSDLDGLPKAIKKYLNYVGVVGKEMPNHFQMNFEGEIKLDKTKDWSRVKGSQVNFLDNEVRLFYLVMKMFGLSINGFHHYENGKASMVGKILDIFKVIDHEGDIMYLAETVTYFNDMCLFVPAALIDANIKWEEIDNNTVMAIYTNNNDVTVSAKLYFNDKGELVDFVSSDRYAISSNGEYEKVRWSTPISEYSDYNGFLLVSKADAVWHYEDNDFRYFRLNVIEYSYE